jgi:glycosyltransferase involved in cell wall biosynthesis
VGAARVKGGVIRTRAVGVVVPVHNEEELLGPALDAVGRAFSGLTHRGVECRTAIVLDGCTDDSRTIARRWACALARLEGPHQSVVLRCRSAGVGEARRVGAAALLREWRAFNPRNIWLATTDADSRVPPAWLAAQVDAHECGADVWTGRVAVEDWSHYDDTTARLWNEAYDAEQAPVHGASMGFNAQIYLNAGGFAPLGTGEDRALHRAILGAGGRALEDMELRVITSGRRLARAPLGFAHALCSLDDDVTVTDPRGRSLAASEWRASSTSSDSGARA